MSNEKVKSALTDLKGLLEDGIEIIKEVTDSNVSPVEPSDELIDALDPPLEKEPPMYSISDGQLVRSGQIIRATSNVIGYGISSGYTNVHINSSKEWWGFSDKWERVDASQVSKIYIKTLDTRKIITVPEPIVVGDYETGLPPSKIKRVLLSAGDRPIKVSETFLGTHINTDVPTWLIGRNDGNSVVPKPKYPVGYVRTLVAAVGGKEERAFRSNIETSPGVYDFSYMDKWMEQTAPSPVVWVNYGTPTWDQKYPNEKSRWPSWDGIASPPKNDKGLAAYIRAVKARYGNRIAAFEVWNEPTLPWGNFTRWSAEFVKANGQHPPFFSGTAEELVNIAKVISENCGDSLCIGCAFVDVWKQGVNTVPAFLQAGGGKYIDALSIHFYDYKYRPNILIDHIDGYRAMLKLTGDGDLPIWGTETGAESPGTFLTNDHRAVTGISRWAFIAAAKGLQSLILYGHIAKPGRVLYMSDPVSNQEVIDSITEAYALCGETLREVFELEDGRIWVRTQTQNELISR